MELLLFVGLQGAGKSTFFRTHFAQTHVLVSKDLLRNNRQPQRRQLQLLEEALAAGRSVVVDNTNPTPEDRQPLIHLGQGYGATIIGYYFESSVSESLKRNRQRQGSARVPDVAIYTTAKKLQPPTYAEGFNTLFITRITGEGQFSVTPLTKDT